MRQLSWHRGLPWTDYQDPISNRGGVLCLWYLYINCCCEWCRFWQESTTFESYQIWVWWYDITTFPNVEVISMYQRIEGWKWNPIYGIRLTYSDLEILVEFHTVFLIWTTKHYGKKSSAEISWYRPGSIGNSARFRYLKHTFRLMDLRYW